MKTYRVITHVKSVMKKIRQNTLFIGIASLVWLLLRSGVRPSRLRYPCQQVSLTNTAVFLSPVIVPLACKLARASRRLNLRVLLLTGFASLWTVGTLLLRVPGVSLEALHVSQVDEPTLLHGTPGVQLGTRDAKGRPVYATSPQALELQVPNRVVSVHDSRATHWDYATGYHWEYIDQAIVNDMVALGVMALTGRTNTIDAWNDLIPYQPGEEVVIKFNFNNSGCSDYDNDIDGYPETANAVIDGLTSIGVPPENIWITDPSRRVPARFRDGITNPDVQYYSRWSCNVSNYYAVDYVDSDSADASVAQCPAGEMIRPSQVFADAEHLINIPQLKSHGQYVTLALKNHYGSVIYRDNSRNSMHDYFYPGTPCDLEVEHILADINDNPHIRDKTRLIIGEGLFGNPFSNWQSVERWVIFGNDDPNVLFFSADPVAISSVMTDYIIAERQITRGDSQGHDQLHAAAGLGLGVHDHWDSFENKHYSAIDYKIIDLDALPTALTLHGTPADRAIHLTWEIDGTLPPTSTWRIDYGSETGTVYLPITDIISPTRAHTLTELTNYVWYTVTLNTVGVTPVLSDTVRVMPTGRFVYLPFLLKGY